MMTIALRRPSQILGAAFALSMITAGTAHAQASQQGLNIYTTREPKLIEPLSAAFTEKTGIKINTVFLKDGLAERVAAEGANSPADLLMAVDIGNLIDVVEKGVTQPIASAAVTQAVPAQLRDLDKGWTALSLRARVFYTAKQGVPANLAYEDLADPKYKGKICIRSGQHPYNTALIAHMIAKQGEAKTEQWLQGVKANLARKPGGGDREVARDILAGLCDIGPANSYYVGLMRSGSGGEEQKKWGEAINVVLPTFQGGGTHVNISGAALAKNAPNKANAIKFLEFLTSDEGQALYAKENFEFPVNNSAKPDPLVAQLGVLKPDPLPLAEVAKNRRAASLLIDKVGFDN